MIVLSSISFNKHARAYQVYRDELSARTVNIGLAFIAFLLTGQTSIAVIWLMVVIATQMLELDSHKRILAAEEKDRTDRWPYIFCGLATFAAAVSYGALMPYLYFVGGDGLKVAAVIWVCGFVAAIGYNWSLPNWLSPFYWAGPLVTLASLGVVHALAQQGGGITDRALPFIAAALFIIATHALHLSTKKAGMTIEAARDDAENSRKEALKSRMVAEKASNAKSEFLAMVSHELRTPLNAILGMTQVLRQGENDPERLKRLETIMSAGDMLLTQLNDILDYSKIEAGRFELIEEPFDPHRLIESLNEIWADAARRKALDFHCEVGQRMPSLILGDASRLKQIMSNLISNAVKFTDEGAVSVFADYEPGENGAYGRFIVHIRDSGPGISAAKQATIFEAFTQADATTSRRHGGTGLGLPICSKLAGLMGGSVSVSSELGQGSTFTLSAPLRIAQGGLSAAEQSAGYSERVESAIQAAAAAVGNGVGFHLGDPDPEAERLGASAPLAPAPAPAPAPADQWALNILSAEDVAINRDVLRLFLDGMGHHVTFAEDGGEAVSIASAQAFDLILMDIRMPNMDGIEATRRIRCGGGPNAETPVVALTADALAGAAGKLSEHGFDGLITKPIIGENLEAVIDAARHGRLRGAGFGFTDSEAAAGAAA